MAKTGGLKIKARQDQSVDNRHLIDKEYILYLEKLKRSTPV